MLPVSETMQCCGQLSGGRWSIAALSVRPVPTAMTIGRSLAQPAGDLGGAGLAEPDGAAVVVGVARHHFARERAPKRSLSRAARSRQRAIGCSIQTRTSRSETASETSRCAAWREIPIAAATSSWVLPAM